MSDLFISYSSHDRTKAERLADELATCGYSVWIDQSGIGGALNWSAEIVDAIAGCTTVVFLISSHSVTSENVAREIHLASEKKKNILPIIIEETQLPRIFEYPLAGLQRVRYERTKDILHALELLKQGHSVLEQMQSSTSRVGDDGFIHLAVLPFDDLSPLHDNEWFADGMMDELIGTLGALEKLRVPSRTDVLYYRTHKPKAKEIAKDLGVRYLVEGSVRKAGEKIRITATLIDTHTNHQLWTNRFDGTFDDIFEFQDKVSREITASLKLKLTPEEVKKLASDPTQNVEAYELYLRGVEYQRLITKDGYNNAVRLFEEAIKLDPAFIDAKLQLANTLIAHYREYDRNSKWLQRAESLLIEAEAIGGETARTLWIRGEIKWIKGELDEAEKSLIKASQIDSNYSGIYNILGNLYYQTNRPQEAVSAFQKAIDIEKSTGAYFNLLCALIDVHEETNAQEIAIESLSLFQKQVLHFPDNKHLQLNYAYVLNCAKKTDEALRQLEDLLRHSDLDGFTLYNIGAFYDELGYPDKNIELFKRAIERSYRDIDNMRNYVIRDQSYQPQIDQLVTKLEKIIRSENL